MKLEILERSGHIEGWQPTSLTPQHTRICSPCSEGSVTKHNSQTWHKKEKECHILGLEPQKSSQREKRNLCHDPSRTACHTQEIPSLLHGFPLPFDTYKQSCLYTKTTRERRRETHFHITRDGFVSLIHSAIAVCAQGDLGDLRRLLFIFIQVPGWKLLVGFRITRGMNLPFWLAKNLETKESKLSFTYHSHGNKVTYQPSSSNPVHITGILSFQEGQSIFIITSATFALKEDQKKACGGSSNFCTHGLIYRHAKNLKFPTENQGVLK